jgi:hypothetical protein
MLLQAAADAGVAGGVDVATSLLSDPEIASAAKALLESQGAGSMALMGSALYFANLLFRKGAFKRLPPGKLNDFLNSSMGGWIVNLTLALGGGALAMAGAPTPISLGAIGSMVIKAVVTAAIAATVHEFQRDVKEAKSAGKAAAENPAPTINA